MRSVAFTLAVVLFVAADGAAQTPVVPGPSGLQVGYRVHEYLGHSYTAPPRQDFAFFQGEPITFQLSVGNLGPKGISLVIQSSDSQQLFQVQAFKAPPLPPENRADRPLAPDRRRFLDESSISIPVAFSSPVKAWAGGQFELPLERETSLEPGESVQWVMSVPSVNLAPGLYRIEVRVNGKGGDQRAVQDFANVRFEVRAGGADARPEILRREALRRMAKDDLDGARQAAAELLRVHSNSVHAYRILQAIADKEGKRDEANSHRQNAEALFSGRRDELLLKHPNGGYVE